MTFPHHSARRDDPRVIDAIANAIEVAGRYNLATHVSLRRNNPETLAYWYGRGCRIFHFTDVALFSDAVKGAVSAARDTVKNMNATDSLAPAQ